MDIPNRIAVLMARFLSSEALPEEEEELKSFFQQHPPIQQHFETLKKLWDKKESRQQATPSLQYIDKQRIERILSKAAAAENMPLEERLIAVHFKRPVFVRYLKYAAAIIVLLVTGSIFFITSHKPASHKSSRNRSVNGEHIITAQSGSRTRTILPDGTTVWLNSGSQIRYKGNLNNAVKEVQLNGEAFFDVVRQSGRPFIVHAGGINIKVLGTAFNVKFYESDKTIETTLLRGSVEVTLQQDKSSHILLKPNEKLVIAKEVLEESGWSKERLLTNGQEPIKVVQFNTPMGEDKLLETAWVYNRLEFRGDSFKELAAKLERWYNVHIEFEDEAVQQLRFNGSFEKESVEEALAALQKVAPFTFKINANEISIKSSE